MEFVVENWTDADTNDLAEWFEFDSDLSRAIGFDHVISRGELEAFILTLTREELDDASMLRAVRQSGSLVGFVCVRNRHGGAGVAHIAVAPWMRGKGVEISRAAIDYAKKDGKLHKLIGMPVTVPFHLQARYLRALGFKHTFVVGEMDI